MDLLSLITTLGLPSAVTAGLTGLSKATLGALNRRSKGTLIEWLAHPGATDAFAEDKRALTALLELRQSLIFERAFGLRTESWLRDQLLEFAEERRESLTFREVLEAARLLSRVSPARLSKMQRGKWLGLLRWTKPLSYLYILLGYAFFVGGLALPSTLDLSGREALAFGAFGAVVGLIIAYLGFLFLKRAHQSEVIVGFLIWRETRLRARPPSSQLA